MCSAYTKNCTIIAMPRVDCVRLKHPILLASFRFCQRNFYIIPVMRSALSDLMPTCTLGGVRSTHVFREITYGISAEHLTNNVEITG